MDVNFEYYKVFYYVAKYGNITKAAAVLGSNQPNVTRVIKLLESQLSCRLLIRRRGGSALRKRENGSIPMWRSPAGICSEHRKRYAANLQSEEES